MLDPVTMSRLALIRQQEILEDAENARRAPLLPLLPQARRLVGGALIALGQRLLSTAQRAGEARPVSAGDSGTFPRPVL